MKLGVREIYEVLRRRYGPQGWWPADSPFEVIVGAILTQNTSWKNVVRAIENLRREEALTPKALHRISPNRLKRLIRPAGFFNVKARRLKNFSVFLHEEYGGKLGLLLAEPAGHMRERLLGVNGIGPETADCIVLYAAGKPSFVVDAYTRRIFTRYGLIAPSSSYDDVRRYFTERLPVRASLYNAYHALLVEHAKRYCLSRPKCLECPLNQGCSASRSPA